MLALLEEPLGNDQDPQPTVTLLIRGPFGRHAWTMQLRHLPRHRSGSKYHAPNLGRPVVMHDTPIRTEIKQKYFPDSIERVQCCKVYVQIFFNLTFERKITVSLSPEIPRFLRSNRY